MFVLSKRLGAGEMSPQGRGNVISAPTGEVYLQGTGAGEGSCCYCGGWSSGKGNPQRWEGGVLLSKHMKTVEPQ